MGHESAGPRHHPGLPRFFLALGLGLLAVMATVFWQSRAATTPTLPPPVIDPALVPLATGEEPVQEIFIRSGCASCHTIPGVAGAEGKVGPKLVLGANGPTRLADPAYKGEARTIREYIHESIVSPGIYVVPGFPDQAMPRWYGKKLSAGALDKIAGYLEGLKEESNSVVNGQ